MYVCATCTEGTYYIHNPHRFVPTHTTTWDGWQSSQPLPSPPFPTMEGWIYRRAFGAWKAHIHHTYIIPGTWHTYVCMYVCMYVMYVCMYTWHVCMYVLVNNMYVQVHTYILYVWDEQKLSKSINQNLKFWKIFFLKSINLDLKSKIWKIIPENPVET